MESIVKIVSFLLFILIISCNKSQEVNSSNSKSLEAKKGSLQNDVKLVLEDAEDCDDKVKKAEEIKIDERGELDLSASHDEGCSLEE